MIGRWKLVHEYSYFLYISLVSSPYGKVRHVPYFKCLWWHLFNLKSYKTTDRVSHLWNQYFFLLMRNLILINNWLLLRYLSVGGHLKKERDILEWMKYLTNHISSVSSATYVQSSSESYLMFVGSVCMYYNMLP